MGKFTNRYESLEMVESQVKVSIKKSELDKSTRLEFGEITESYNSYVVIKFNGGLKGDGKLEDYFSNLSDFVKELKKYFSSVWLVSMENNVMGDIFTLTIGVSLDRPE